MIETTMREAQRRGWRRVGVLTFRMIPVYDAVLQRQGIAYETIPAELAASLDEAIMKLTAGIETPRDRAIAREAVGVLRARGVDGIILGCTEIPPLLQEEAPDLINRCTCWPKPPSGTPWRDQQVQRVEKGEGDPVIGGTINQQGLLRIRGKGWQQHRACAGHPAGGGLPLHAHPGHGDADRDHGGHWQGGRARDSH